MDEMRSSRAVRRMQRCRTVQQALSLRVFAPAVVSLKLDGQRRRPQRRKHRQNRRAWTEDLDPVLPVPVVKRISVDLAAILHHRSLVRSLLVLDRRLSEQQNTVASGRIPTSSQSIERALTWPVKIKNVWLE